MYLYAYINKYTYTYIYIYIPKYIYTYVGAEVKVKWNINGVQSEYEKNSLDFLSDIISMKTPLYPTVYIYIYMYIYIYIYTSFISTVYMYICIYVYIYMYI
jgi:hypothetical protein